ncbi:peptidylprolyl isomerase [Brevundimonas sp. Root1423]|uniref:peptidylprolyl isomerase n=1 Tax=Brevundimonas sp. Root1423 TaxID=1736462 RepID=UPI0006FA18EE|nr:peptidylprolyl isomerase [Brevundimonas sp. Root1423]KQY80320.1 peptidylprolyl isomerase [Brevundimonas sp. Root1423]
MIRRTLLALLLCLAAPVAAVAQDSAAVRVAIETEIGTILAETDPRAPVTSANFLRYVDEGRFDGTTFYRGMVLSPAAGLIQGGTSGAPERVLPPIAHEPTHETGLTHTDGALSMARFDPGTATGDFFIIVGNVSSLDAGKSAPGDPGFAVFGRVVEGMDIVRQILAAPKSPTEGEGFMRGQMLDPRIRIVSVRRVPIQE